MRVVAGNALEPIDAVDLMRMGDLLQFHFLGVALVAGRGSSAPSFGKGEWGL